MSVIFRHSTCIKMMLKHFSMVFVSLLLLGTEMICWFVLWGGFHHGSPQNTLDYCSVVSDGRKVQQMQKEEFQYQNMFRISKNGCICIAPFKSTDTRKPLYNIYPFTKSQTYTCGRDYNNRCHLLIRIGNHYTLQLHTKADAFEVIWSSVSCLRTTLQQLDVDL